MFHIPRRALALAGSRHARRTSVAPAGLALVAAAFVFGVLVFATTAVAQSPDGGGTIQTIDEIEVIADGGRYYTPIAVPNTYNYGDSNPDSLQDSIASTIRTCLQISGFFQVYGPDRFFFDPDSEGMTASTINFGNWHNVGAQGLIKTSFRVATNQAALDFRLYSVDSGQQIDIGYTPVTVPLSDVRGEVYRFINLVIYYYTGNMGIFGSRIAFAARGESGMKQIYVTSMDGLSMSSVTSNRTLNVLPSFGPGGGVFYTSYQRGNPDLYLGGELFSSRPGTNMGARLSPRGDEVAVTLTMDGNAEIYILDTQGEILRRCTDNPAEDVDPTWSPDGSMLAFVSDRSGGPQIFVMNADCSGQRRVTFAGNYNTEPDWSPTENLIAFTGRDSRNRFDIFTVEPDTGYIRRLTQDQGNNEHPSWSPDGNYLVFSSTRGGAKRLYITTSDGEHQTSITPDGDGFETPYWQR